MADTQEKKSVPAAQNTQCVLRRRKKLINRLKRVEDRSEGLSVCWRMMRTVTIS